MSCCSAHRPEPPSWRGGDGGYQRATVTVAAKYTVIVSVHLDGKTITGKFGGAP
jgi:hypothetical protein